MLGWVKRWAENVTRHKGGESNALVDFCTARGKMPSAEWHLPFLIVALSVMLCYYVNQGVFGAMFKSLLIRCAEQDFATDQQKSGLKLRNVSLIFHWYVVSTQ